MTLYLPAISGGATGALLLVGVVLLVPLLVFPGGSVLLLVDKVEVPLDLQPITRAVRKRRAKALWARDRKVLVVSF
jgi:hypothetical protein